MSEHYTTCPLCEATCGLEVRMQEGAITRIAGDKHDSFSRGFICPKGASLGQLHSDPDRLRAPLMREPTADGGPGEFREVTWEEAFACINKHLLPGLRGDPNAAAVYLGNPNVHSLAGVLFPRGIIRALGTRNVFSASTVDQMPKHVACGLMYGDPFAISVPDLDRTDYLLMLGANPWESNGSLCTAPDFPGRLRELLERGGRFVVVDPRRTRTAEHASEHIRIRPGTDAYLLLSMACVMFRDGLVRPGRVAAHLAGLDELAKLVECYTPAAASAVTGVAAETIERLAHELASRERAVVYGRMGTHTVGFGTLAAWAVDVLNAITGHLDQPGGAMWARPAHAPKLPGLRPGKAPRAFSVGRWKSRVKGYPEALGELPAATLADEIETPGPGQVRVLVTVAGNPVLSTPDSARLDRALSTLTFMVSVDPYLNETTRHAHVILPPPSPLSRAHYDMALSGFGVRNHVRWSPPLLPATGPSEAEILARLTLIAAGQGVHADAGVIFQAVEQHLLATAIQTNPALSDTSPVELADRLQTSAPLDRYVEILVRSGAYGDAFGAQPEGLTFERLKQSPHGIDLGPLQPALPERLRTPSGKVELVPEPIRRDLERARAALEQASGQAPAFVLIGRRELRSNNSWMHNLPILMKGPARCTLQLHPQDASRLNIDSGGLVRVRTSVGEVVVPAEVTDALMPGVVSLPHGYGHGRPGTQLRVAGAHAGVNFNLLTDAQQLDPLSGNAVLNGLCVSLSPA